MYIATVPNRNSPAALLLRESFRQNGKVKNRTLANLSHWPPARIEALRRLLRGEFDQSGFGPTLACEYLAKEHQVEVSKETLRQWRFWRLTPVALRAPSVSRQKEKSGTFYFALTERIGQSAWGYRVAPAQIDRPISHDNSQAGGLQ
jgi:hypothetical protein